MTHLYLRIEDTLYPNLADNREFLTAVTKLFKRFYQTVTLMFVSEQLQELRPYLGKGYKTLSLDPLFTGDYNVEVSRCYCELTESFYKHILRPESRYTDINTMYAEQVLAIPVDTNLVIVEDDCVNGRSLSSVIGLVRKRLLIEPEVLVFKDVRKETNVEILDLRDFIPNTPYGGLVVIDSECNIRRRCYLELKRPMLTERMGLSYTHCARFTEAFNDLLRDLERKSLLPF